MANGADFGDLRLGDVLRGATDFLTHPLALAGLSIVGGRYAPRTTRFGLAGLETGMQLRDLMERRRRQEEAAKKLTDVTRSLREPTTTETPKSLEELEGERGRAALDVGLKPGLDLAGAVGRVSPTRTVTEAPSQSQRLAADLVDAVAASGNVAGAANLLSKELTPDEFSLGPGQARFRSGRKIAELPAKAESPFAKPRVPTPKDYTAESIRRWRETRTRENPEGDFSVLVPREDPLKRDLTQSQIDRNKAIAERVRRERATKVGSVAYQEFLQFGGDPNDQEGYLDFLDSRKERMARQPQGRRGDVKEARQALVGVAESEAFTTSDDETKKRLLENSANEFGYTIIGDPLSKGYLFGIAKGKFDPSRIGLAPIQAKPRLQREGGSSVTPSRKPTAEGVLRKFGVQ